MKSSVLARIYKNGGQQSASLAVFQMVNGCAAQLSGQVLTRCRSKPAHLVGHLPRTGKDHDVFHSRDQERVMSNTTLSLRCGRGLPEESIWRKVDVMMETAARLG